MSKFHICKPRTVSQLRAHPLVDEVLDERSDDNGWWVYFKPGYINTMTETHCIHEMTVKEVCSQFDYIEKCNCNSCKASVSYDDSGRAGNVVHN